MTQPTLQPDYGASAIKVLEGLEAVRKRPGMYIGSTSARGLHHLVWEIVDNAVDEALAGHCRNIEIALLDDDVVSVTDDGRGVPVEIHPQYGVSAATLVFTKLHAGAKFENQAYKVSGGLHGVGASVVNALSQWMEVTIWREGQVWRQRFERGEPKGVLTAGERTRKRGTRVVFRPDTEIFPDTTYHFETLQNRFREMAFLNGGLRLVVTDQRTRPEGEVPPSSEFCYEGGISSFVAYLNEGRHVLHPIIAFRDTMDNIEVEVALQYHTDYSESVASFVNCIGTVEGGTHETGFKLAHTRVMNEYGRKLGVWKKKENLTGEDLREGLTCILSVRMGEVQFEGQTKGKLGSPEARAAVEKVVDKHLATYLEEHPDIAREVLDKASKAAAARDAARKARAAVRSGDKGGGRTSLEGKLTRCTTRDPMERELFLVEGDSAGGSAKQARDSRTQAILPLRGKPLNTERAPLAKVLQNKEILAITQAIGAGVGTDFALDDAQYGRVVILADADDDGAHIRCLLLTFFYRFMRELVRGGRVYIAQPPLYRVTWGVKSVKDRYAWTDGELKRLLDSKAQGRGKPDVQRFKGLGEMAATQLWDTTMNPETRTLKRVELEDAAAAEHHVTVLMGEGTEARRNWITENVPFGIDEPPVPLLA